mmetsp:Transcript_2233/g.4413  ORF Transcript_2233/g.4413 Transcript_2233/m.4413 type:complete len:709 (-) Transcript_2233:79-2205(-)
MKEQLLRTKRKRQRSPTVVVDREGQRYHRRLWWTTTLLLVSLFLSSTEGAQAPAVVGEQQMANDPPNRINAPNRSREKKTSTTRSSSATTDSLPSKSRESKPMTVQFPTPQKDQSRPVNKASSSDSSSRSADNNNNNNINNNNNHKLRAKHEDENEINNNKQDKLVSSSSQHDIESDFMKWCTDILGIDTILEIQTFEYYDYMRAMPQEDWNDDDDDTENDDGASYYQDFPLLPVRGLAASRDIAVGEVVIRIPLGALLSVATTIDQDPVLNTVMGPQARQTHGWAAAATDETSALLEMPLLAVALLYHVKLGTESPLHPYIQILQLTAGLDQMPFLWNPTRLRTQASEGVRMVARGIQRDMNDMYNTVVPVLVEQYPQIFGPPPSSQQGQDSSGGSEGGDSTTTSDDKNEDSSWMFSREKFQWAFAMITTRHWQLPIEDLPAAMIKQQKNAVDDNNQQQHPKNMFEDSAEDAGLPPASTPTDHWVEEHQGDLDDEISGTTTTNQGRGGVLMDHSFLAPFADLLNFGPPCTRGRYDSQTHSFEITALCDFKKGQEVTFYYSDECDHVVVAAYGFLHPIVPPCPSAEEYRRRSEEWQRRSEKLQDRLGIVYQALEAAEMDLDQLYEYLESCECCRREFLEGRRRTPRNRTDDDDDDVMMNDDDTNSGNRLRHEHVRGAAHTEKDREARHGSSRTKRRWRREQIRSGSEF